MSAWTLSEQIRALQTREMSATEAVQAHLRRIDAVDVQIGAFLSVEAEQALDRAAQIDRMDALPPLAGIPVALKDNICVRNGKTTCASRMLADHVSPYSATAWEKLSQAGCILLGKTNMDEFGMGSTTEHSAFHPTKNPHDLRCVPGGSSGGSAAAVASGEVLLALGSDTGGSVRQPAAHCGVVGMKPTYGAVSRYGLVAFASSLEQIGPITANVADNALALGFIAGRDAYDATSAACDADYCAQLGQDIAGLRIGLPREMFQADMQAEVRAAILRAASTLEKLGAQLVEISLPGCRNALPAYYVISAAEASSNLARFDGVRYGRRADKYTDLEEMYVLSRSQGLGDEVKRRILLGTYVLSAGYYDQYYRRAQQVRHAVTQDLDCAFGEVDCILAPTMPTTAPRLGALADPVSAYQDDLFTVPANIAGIPALSMPCGADENGLPIGVQLMGPRWSEALLYRVGHVLEKTLGPVTGEVKLG